MVVVILSTKVPVLPAVAVPQAILPQAIIAPGVIHIAQDNANAKPAQEEAPVIVLAHAPAVIQLDAHEDAQIAQDIAITPQANAAPAAAQQAQPDQYISPQDIYQSQHHRTCSPPCQKN